MPDIEQHRGLRGVSQKGGSGEIAGGQPIYFAYYEERKFRVGHYQAIEPQSDSNITVITLYYKYTLYIYYISIFILNLIQGFLHFVL